MAESEKRGRGRPRIELDLKTVEGLALIGCEEAEIVTVLGISERTMRSRKHEKRFAAAMERGRANGKKSLRRLQWEAANKHDRTMLVWLGKQFLGQKDRQDVVHSGTGPGGSIQVDVAAIELIESRMLQLTERRGPAADLQGHSRAEVAGTPARLALVGASEPTSSAG